MLLVDPSDLTGPPRHFRTSSQRTISALAAAFRTEQLIPTSPRNSPQTAAVFIKNLLHQLKVFCGDEKQDDNRAVLVVDSLLIVDAQGQAMPGEHPHRQALQIDKNGIKDLSGRGGAEPDPAVPRPHALAEDLRSKHRDSVQRGTPKT